MPIAQGTQMWMSDADADVTLLLDVQRTCLVTPHRERLQILQPRHYVEEVCPCGGRINRWPSLQVHPLFADEGKGSQTEDIILMQFSQRPSGTEGPQPRHCSAHKQPIQEPWQSVAPSPASCRSCAVSLPASTVCGGPMATWHLLQSKAFRHNLGRAGQCLAAHDSLRKRDFLTTKLVMHAAKTAALFVRAFEQRHQYIVLLVMHPSIAEQSRAGALLKSHLRPVSAHHGEAEGSQCESA